MNPLDLLVAFLTLGLTEAVVKPLAKRWVQRRILKAAPAILREVDRRLPELLALRSAPALAMALPVGRSKASDGDSRAFLNAWQQARDLGLATSEQAELLRQLAVAHDLPPEFCAALSRTRARNADGTFRADDPTTPDINEAWE